jgi:hypothetical protein
VAVAHPQATFAETPTGIPVNYLDVTSVNLAVELGLGESQLSWASPSTVQPDQPRWRISSQDVQGVEFSLHDPAAASRMSRNSFLAGIYLSIATGALLLLLEKFIEAVLRWRRL